MSQDSVDDLIKFAVGGFFVGVFAAFVVKERFSTKRSPRSRR